jgi:hypothetical protein
VFVKINIITVSLNICCEKALLFTKVVEASAFVLSDMYFSQHMNQGKCFAHSELKI